MTGSYFCELNYKSEEYKTVRVMVIELNLLNYIFSFATCITAIFSLIFGLLQWKRSLVLKRANYINELTETIRTDRDIRDIVYMLDYRDEWYTSEFHNSGEFEWKIDRTLSYFSYIAYLWEMKILSKKEFEFVRYEIERILINTGIRDYFYNLYHFSKKQGVPFTFVYLLNYGKKYYPNIYDRDFFDKTSCLPGKKNINGMIYHKNLNF